MTPFDSGEVTVDGLVFPYLERGAGPLLLCLHGFPDSPRSFRYQLEGLAEAGYRVVSPFARGYARTNQRGSYQGARFGRDVVAMISALGHDDAVVLGHDWGASAAYAAALLSPARVKRLIAAAVPYGMGMPQALLMNPAQQRRSWYMFFFQSRLADAAVPFGDFAFIDALYRDWSPGFTLPDAEAAHLKGVLGTQGVLDAALEYYRVAFGTTRKDPALEAEESRLNADPIEVPSLYLHGRLDGCIGVEVTEGMAAFFPKGLEHVVIDGAGHFLHQEKPEAFNRAVLDFLARQS
jgi:pimeloyl-ACP methyl ester carboxylesterase